MFPRKSGYNLWGADKKSTKLRKGNGKGVGNAQILVHVHKLAGERRLPSCWKSEGLCSGKEVCIFLSEQTNVVVPRKKTVEAAYESKSGGGGGRKKQKSWSVSEKTLRGGEPDRPSTCPVSTRAEPVLTKKRTKGMAGPAKKHFNKGLNR